MSSDADKNKIKQKQDEPIDATAIYLETALPHRNEN